ncbi:subclass B3 metallo-beta-lactamase [Sphingomonas sp.]|uniref:subclass B3 metallo-beta-lactamase n=1 Tax=Sphingomonas sp. TaxID=28214 RepID=UPI003B3A493B
MPARAAYDVPKSWTRPIAPFRVIDGIYYVGTEGLAAYLIVSDGAAALIDGTMAENVPAIEANIRRLGFRPDQIRILLNTHAHFDHAAGLARLKQDTGASLLAREPDVQALEEGRHIARNVNGQTTMPSVAVDGVIRDGETVPVGRLTLEVIATPGHTAGCTSFAVDVTERGRTFHVLMPCSLTVAGNVLPDNPTYPDIVTDFRRTFDRLAKEKADIVLTAHPEIADVLGRARRRDAGEADAFVDPALLGRLVVDARAAFERELAEAQAR